VVENSTCNSEIKGSNLVADTRREKMAKNVRHMTSSTTAVAKNLTRNTKNEGSNPTTGTGREKMAKMYDIHN
jgi:hypothetical protein